MEILDGGLSDYLRDQVAALLFDGDPFTPPANMYAALFSTTLTGAGVGSELLGFGYERKLVGFTTPPVNSSVSNVSSLTWSNLPEATLNAVAIFDSLTLGNMLYYANLNDPVAIPEGEWVIIPAESFKVTLVNASNQTGEV